MKDSGKNKKQLGLLTNITFPANKIRQTGSLIQIGGDFTGIVTATTTATGNGDK